MRGRILAWPFFVDSPGFFKHRPMADDLDNTIRDNAQGPAKVAGDAGSVEQHKPSEQIEADRYLAAIHEILEQDKAAPRKQRHTIQRIFDRLRAEHGYTGGMTVVGDVVREWRATTAPGRSDDDRAPGGVDEPA